MVHGGGVVLSGPDPDLQYISRLLHQLRGMRPRAVVSGGGGAAAAAAPVHPRAALLAFDYVHDEGGGPQPEVCAFGDGAWGARCRPLDSSLCWVGDAPSRGAQRGCW